MDKKIIRQWYLRYQKYGEDGLHGTRSFHYTAKEKLMIAENTKKINIGSVKLYRLPTLDMFNGKIIPYSISEKPNLEQIYDMLAKAFAKFNNLDGLILHSDQG